MALGRVSAAMLLSRIILALNIGSSSLKFGVFRAEQDGVGGVTIESLLADTVLSEHPAQSLAHIAAVIQANHLPAPELIGHRFVHGGLHLRQHCLLNASVLQQLEAAIPFAPLHNKTALAAIHAAQAHYPQLPQAVCFDTTFHADMPEIASRLPIPQALHAEGIQRYGFHGISCASILQQLGEPATGRLIVAHLGNGASITAIQQGKSMDTSMGFTPNGGMMMGTRSGDLDPAVLSYLMREKHYDAAAIESMVDHDAGLLGVSGISGDMQALHQAASHNEDARLAIAMFCYAARKQIAAMVAVLGGLDLLVFTGGIGEHDALIRATICAGLSCVGIHLDEARNASSSNPISGHGGCQVLVMQTEEERQIAWHSFQLLYK